MSKQLYNFGVNKELARPEERKTLAWPVAVWSCLIPDEVAPKINILEKLILKLVSIKVPNVKEALCDNIGFSRDLVEAAIESCYVKGYLDKRKISTGTMALNKEGEELLDSIENPYERDMETVTSGVTRKVYMIQDLVTKSVIPCFDIEKLPSSYSEDEDAIVVRFEDWENKKPSIASVQTALRYWARLQNNLRNGFREGKNTIELTETVLCKDESVSGFIPFEEEEVDWKTIGQEDVEKEVTTLADVEEKQKTEFEKITQLTIFDDRPEVYYAMGYLAINRNNPEEAMILSPFGERLDDWFRTVINRLRVTDEGYRDELQLFLEMKREELGDKIAFNNDLEIRLFEDHPLICNNPRFAFLKQAIINFTKSKIRICNNDDDSHNFNTSMRTALEIFFRCVLTENPELAEVQKELKALDDEYVNKKKRGIKCTNEGYQRYLDNLNVLVNSYSFLSEDIIGTYKGNNIYRNFLNSNTVSGYTNGYLAMILMDAVRNKNGKSMRLLHVFQEFPLRVIGLTREGNDSVHGGKQYLKTHYNPEEAEEKYSEFEKIINSVYGHFMEG